MQSAEHQTSQETAFFVFNPIHSKFDSKNTLYAKNTGAGRDVSVSLAITLRCWHCLVLWLLINLPSLVFSE